MNRFTVEWRQDIQRPESPDFRQAVVTIDSHQCLLRFVDHVAPSGRRYISLTVQAPYQGRGRALHVEVNGVALSLDWNGGNVPAWPARPQHAQYRRERLTPEQSVQLLNQETD